MILDRAPGAALADGDPVDALNALPLEGAARAVAALPFARAVQLLDRADLARRAGLFERLHARYAASVVEAMSPDQRARLFRSLAPAERHRLAQALAPAVREELERLLRWPAASAAGIMTTSCVALPPTCTVGRALERLAESDDGSLAFAAVFVVDPEDDRLVAAYPMRALVRADRASRLAWLDTRAPLVAVAPLESIAAVERVVRRHDLAVVPVVHEGRLVGVVTVDDVLDAGLRRRDGDARRAAGLAAPDERDARPPVGLATRARALVGAAALQLAGALLLLAIVPPTARWLAPALLLAPALAAAGCAAAQGAMLATRALRAGNVAGRRAVAALLGRELRDGLALGAAAALVIGGGLAAARWLPWGATGPIPASALAPSIAALALALVPLGAVAGAGAALAARDDRREARPVSFPALRVAVDLVGLAVVALVLRLVAGG